MKHFCSFSEAIREGAKLRPQAFHALSMNGGTCAFGAGLEAIEQVLHEWAGLDEIEGLSFMFPYLQTIVACPVSGCAHIRRSIQDTIIDLNDEHRWTREAIADWLESEEEKLGFVTLTEQEQPLAASPELAEVTV